MNEQVHNDENYNPDKASIIAHIMVQIYKEAQIHGAEFIQQHLEEYKEIVQQYAQQYTFEKGLKLYKECGEEAAMAELHCRVCFTPILVSKLTAEEKWKAQLALMLLSEKSSAKIKG